MNGLRLVALFKFAKAILLLAAGLGALGLLHPNVVTALILNLAVVAYLLWRIRARPDP